MYLFLYEKSILITFKSLYLYGDSKKKESIPTQILAKIKIYNFVMKIKLKINACKNYP